MPELRIGISGWRYPGWRGNFYPEKLPQRRELSYASSKLNSIEINGSFYSLQKPEYYAQWYAETPEDFVFSVKAPRYITHIRRLRDIAGPLANFFASGVFNLKEKLGPVLWQFPPTFKYDAALFEDFLARLPHETDAAAKLARKRDAWMNDRVLLTADASRPLRHAVEIRHASFVDPSFVDMLRKHGVALVVADAAGKWPYYEDVCADFVYLRLHGETELYSSGYDAPALDRWAARIRSWSAGKQPSDARLISAAQPPRSKIRPVHCYFDNDYKVRAPFDAQGLMQRLGVIWEPEEKPTQKRTPSPRASKGGQAKGSTTGRAVRTLR